MSATHINDGGTWRKLKKIFVKDGETIWRQIKKVFVNDAGVWRQVFSGISVIELTADIVDFNPTLPIAVIGYSTTFGMGSINPTTLNDGKFVANLYDLYGGGTAGFSITGLSEDPGQNFITSITANSVTLLGSAATYNYTSGTAGWSWPTGFGFAVGQTYTVEIDTL